MFLYLRQGGYVLRCVFVRYHDSSKTCWRILTKCFGGRDVWLAAGDWMLTFIRITMRIQEFLQEFLALRYMGNAVYLMRAQWPRLKSAVSSRIFIRYPALEMHPKKYNDCTDLHPCLLSVAVECAIGRLSTCSLAWSAVLARAGAQNYVKRIQAHML